MMMKIKFSLLLVVLLTLVGCGDNKVDCYFCHGTGIFTGYNGISEKCMVCEGNGKTTKEHLREIEEMLSQNVQHEEKEAYCAMCYGTGKFQHHSSPFVSACSFCNGTGLSNDNRYNSTKPRYSCLYCNGSGMNQFTGAFCTFCEGYGLSYYTPEQQNQMVTTPVNNNDNSNGNNSNRKSQQLCSACGGSGSCPICKNTGGVKYGNIRYCSTCGNTSKCPWCYGRGIVEY